MDPLNFWYDNLGRYLCPNAENVQDGVAKALSQNYAHANKPSFLRMGSGKAVSLIQDGQATLMADIEVPAVVSSSCLKVMPSEWRTVPNWLAELILNPPEPPSMIVVYGKNPAIQDKLRLNVTRDILEICGAQMLRCRPSVVREALAIIGDMPASAWRRAAYLDYQCIRDPNSRMRKYWESEIDKMNGKHPSLESILEALPQFGSGDYEAVTLVHSVEAKNNANAARLAAEIESLAA